MDRGTERAVVHGVARSPARLSSSFTFTSVKSKGNEYVRPEEFELKSIMTPKAQYFI